MFKAVIKTYLNKEYLYSCKSYCQPTDLEGTNFGKQVYRCRILHAENPYGPCLPFSVTPNREGVMETGGSDWL